MSRAITIIVVISVILCTTIFAIYFIRMKNWISLLIYILLMIAIVILFHLAFNFPSIDTEPISKGGESIEWPFLVILYLFIILGMLSQYMFNYLSVPKQNRPGFDFGLFIAPLFFSPLVVLPLYSAFTNADIVINPLSQQSLMIYIVAFENGFFWKAIMAKRGQGFKNKNNEIES